MRRNGSARIAGLVVGTLGAASLHAQAPAESRAVGPFVGIGAETNVIAPNPGGASSASEPGHGGGLVLGYGFSRRWAAYGHIGLSRFRGTHGDETGTGSWDVGARVHFRAGPNAVVPFLQAGFSDRALSDATSDAVGAQRVLQFRVTPALGGGANVHLSPGTAISASALWSVGHFVRPGSGGVAERGTSGGVTRPLLHLGVLLFPRR